MWTHLPPRNRRSTGVGPDGPHISPLWAIPSRIPRCRTLSSEACPPSSGRPPGTSRDRSRSGTGTRPTTRSEEHTSELQSRFDLVCRLLLEKKNLNDMRLHHDVIRLTKI